MQINKKASIEEFLAKYGIFFVLIFMVIIASIISPVFLTSRNIINVIRQISVVTIIACGETVLLISGMVDLSAGSALALSGIIAADVGIKTGSLTLALLTGLAIGAATGLVNGFIITRFNIPPFIVTLAMMLSARGIILLYTNAAIVTGLDKNFTFLGRGFIGPIPVPILILLFILVVSWFLLNQTKFGQYIYAIGGNQQASMAAGINVKKIKILAFMINGLLVGVAGIVLVARINAGPPGEGAGYEFDAIIAAIVGGTSLYGGIGNIPGTLIGALIIQVLKNILNLVGVSPYWQMILTGILIVGALILDMVTKKARIRKV